MTLQTVDCIRTEVPVHWRVQLVSIRARRVADLEIKRVSFIYGKYNRYDTESLDLVYLIRVPPDSLGRPN
jgi:hypothetical protein